jgi:enterochelin esterase family protein
MPTGEPSNTFQKRQNIAHNRGLMRSLPLVLVAALLLTSRVYSAEDYKLGPDSQVQPGVPQGEVKKGTFENSKLFPGTRRDYWVYVPKQYDGSKPANLMLFMDGGGYVKADGQFRAPVVFDNLIAHGELPVTIGVFVNPGTIPAAEPGGKDRSTRSYEYDSMGDLNARFLIEEVLPVATEGLNITPDPEGWGVCGISSSGIAAFTLAWERPDRFRKVIAQIGSFTNIRGGFAYPALIRKSKKAPKPLRVFLQDGVNDLDNLHGHWPLAAQDMEAALKFAGYDYQLVMGDGGHSGKHGGAILPETLKWLWRPAAAQ